jgi:hypothetical protein
MTSTLRLLPKPFALALSLFAMLAVLAVTTAARADDAQTIVIVVEGGGGEKLAAAIANTLPSPWTRSDPKAFARASKKHKVGGAKALDSAKTKGRYVDRLLAATHDVHASAVLVVRVAPAKKRRTAKVMLFAADDKKPVTHTSVKLGAPSHAKDAAAVESAIAPDLEAIPPAQGAAATGPEAGAAAEATGAAATTPGATAGAPNALEPEPSKPGEPAESGATASGDAASTTPGRSVAGGEESPALLDASVGIDFSSRHFDYNDAVTSNLRPYDVDFVPAPAVKLELYPLAKSKAGVFRDIGLTGGFHAALGLQSKAPDGTKIATTWSRIDIGLRARLRLAPGASPPAIGIDVGYGRETFAFRDQGLRIQNELPTVGYELLRVGLDARVPIGPVALFGGAYYLPILHSGDVGKRIRGQTAGGVEAELGVAVPFARRFEARAGVDYRRFFYSFQPIPGDPVVAGGALDQLLRAELALAFVY